MSGMGKKITYDVDNNGCFINTSHSIDIHGYPHIWYKGRAHNMHRVIYIKKFGEIEKGLVIRHKCDNRRCININHLEVGTRKDNSNDCKIRGRLNTPIGEKRKDCKLTDKQVLEIRKDIRNQNLIAKYYKISQSTVSKIKSMKKRSYVKQ